MSVFNPIINGLRGHWLNKAVEAAPSARLTQAAARQEHWDIRDKSERSSIRQHRFKYDRFTGRY
jgi:hypothetical protein